MRRNLLFIAYLLFGHFCTSQTTELLNENFNSGLPDDWKHCSGNSGINATWEVKDSMLTTSNGPYFGRVLDGIQLPSVNLMTITNPRLELDLSMNQVKSDIQLSLYYSEDSTCKNQWNNDESYYYFSNKTLLQSITYDDSLKQFTKIYFDLSPLVDKSNLFLTLTADYMNYFAEGTWKIDNVKVRESQITNSTDFFEKQTISLYPNPANNLLNILGVDHHTDFQIIDNLGQVVYSCEGMTVNVQKLKAGLYFVLIKNRHFKFIKE